MKKPWLMSVDGADAHEARYASLTESVRGLIDATIRSTAEPAAVASAKAEIDAAVGHLSSSLIPGSFGVQHADTGRNLAWGNAVIGLRNAIAPPLSVQYGPDGRVWADVTLGAAYEGPPGHVHGGVCALLLDHILGATAHQPGRPAVTGTLTVRYERGIRLGALRAEACVDRIEGVKTFAVGHLSDGNGVAVRAEGVFIHPRSGAR